MLKARIVTEENAKDCARMLHVAYVSMRSITSPTWILWDEGRQAFLLPHVVFANRFTVVGTEDDYKLVERI